jgi:CRISPR-associated protein Cmr2
VSIDRLFGLKARALLLPSPYEVIDPGGEEARQAVLRDWLREVGVEVDERGIKLIERCAEDARDAQVPIADLPAGAARLVHPLSAQVLQAHFDLLTTNDWIGELPRPRGESEAAWYRRLWRHVMKLGDALPGSVHLPDHTVAAHRSLTAALAGARMDGGRAALLYLHIGPVQSFIEAARRTHDLWISSFTVGFLTFAAVRAVTERLGPDAIVYPDLSALPLAARLVFGDGPQTKEEKAALVQSSLANRLLAVVPESTAKELAEAAAKAVADTWKEMGALAQKRLGLANSVAKGFAEQLEAHLEIDAVVQPWPSDREGLRRLLREASATPPWWLGEATSGTPEDRTGAAYGSLFDLTHRVLSAHRKALAPPAQVGDARPKCTVCGAREQMGPIASDPRAQQHDSRTFFEKLSKQVQSKGSDEAQRPSLQIGHGEGLCAVCLTKRFAPEVFYGAGAQGAQLGLCWTNRDDRPLLRFPSVASVASAPLRFYLRAAERDRATQTWIEALTKLDAPDQLNFEPPGNLLPGLGPIGRTSRLLSIEGAWLYETSYEPDTAWRNHFAGSPPERGSDAYRSLAAPLSDARTAFGRVRERVEGRGASPYYAVVVLDGDWMGKWLTGRHEDTPKLREIAAGASAAIAGKPRPLYPALHAELSRRLGRLAQDLHKVVGAYLGRVVYSGGDDLLALLPLQTVLPCLDALRRKIRAPEHLGDRVTISAGVAIAHWRDPLGPTLQQAREAERDAKDAGRNALAVRLDKRSGAQVALVLPWEVDLGKLDPLSIPAWAADLDRALRFDVLEWLRTLVVTDAASRERPLAGTKAAYQLEQEVATLGALSLREPLLHRVDVLLDLLVSTERWPKTPELRAFLRSLLAFWDARRITRVLGSAEADRIARENACMLVDFLLLARFLVREEHGIVTGELLRQIEEGASRG